MQFTDRNLCLTDRQKPVRTVRNVRIERTEFNPSKTIRASQRNILSVDNDMRVTKGNLCLTDRKTFTDRSNWTDRTNWIQPFQED